MFSGLVFFVELSVCGHVVDFWGEVMVKMGKGDRGLGVQPENKVGAGQWYASHR